MKRDIPAGRAVPADWLSNFDRYLISEGTHERAYEKLGAHLIRFGQEQGVVFAVWAPNARRVQVMGDFNWWQGDDMEFVPGTGVWATWKEGVGVGTQYKYKIQYRVHMRDKGWGAWTDQGEVAGTTGEGRRMEALQIRVPAEL